MLSIMEIERFAIHDGPGIRTTVFLQGCPLHCHWCANPESQKIGSQLMYYKNKCVSCGRCVHACQHQAIEMYLGHPRFVRKRCQHCQECANACLQNAISFVGEKRAVDDIITEILRDKAYYDSTGGGVTISGGEAFVQFTGFKKLLQACKVAHLHTAVETCGHVKLEQFKEALPYIDLFLFDFKHIDGEKFKAFTGGKLEIILKNLHYLAENAPEKVIIRVPVIPSFNYDKETLEQIMTEAANMGFKELHLLPYHTFGMPKYERLGKKYKLEAQSSLYEDELMPYKKWGEALGLTVKIGG